MIRLLFPLIIVLILITTSAFGQLNKVTKKYNPYSSELNVSMGVLVKKDGQIKTTAIGNHKFTEHTVFNIGSATKKITAILILQELEKGHLKLSDTIGQYLHPITHVNGRLTIESLLRHRSGLGELVGKNIEQAFYAKSDAIYNANFLDQIPKSDSNTLGKHHYCNTNYILLGKILETITDKSYFDLLRERIFEPAQMNNSYPYVSKGLKNLAPPTHKGKDVSSYLDYRFFANYAYAAGSIASTLHDMEQFYVHLFEKKTFLNDRSLTYFTSFDDANYGLGIMRFKNNYIGHGGNNIGYSYREFYNPKTKNLILIFANALRIPFGKMLEGELFDLMNNTYDEGVEFNPNICRDYKSVKGNYLFDTQGITMEMSIIEKNNHLYFSTQGIDILLVSKEKNKLYNGSFGIELEVTPNTVNELIFRQHGLETIIKRINI